MDLLGFQALVGFATCFALVLWTMIPVFLSQKTRSRKLSVRQQQRLQAVLSLANCFACGVFLSTCFFGMVPHAHKHFAHVAMKYGAGPGQDCLSSHSISTPLKQLHQRSPSSDNVSSTNLVTSSASTTTVDPTWTPIFKYLYSKPYPEILFMVGFILTLLIEELVHVCQQTCCANRRKHPSSGHAHYAPVTNFAIPLADTSTASSRHADDNSLSISVPKKGLPLNTTSKTVHNQNDVNTEDVLLDLSSGGPINDSTIQLVKNANGANLNSNLNNGGKSGKTGFSIATTKKHTRWEQEPLVDLDGNESDDDHWDLPAPRLTTHDDHNDSVADLVTDAAGGHGHHHVPTLVFYGDILITDPPTPIY